MNLLDGIPERLWDDELSQGLTPREAQQHFDATGCRACHWLLTALAESLKESA